MQMERAVRHLVRFVYAAVITMVVFTAREALGQELTLAVKHDHVIGSCKGDLIINSDGIEYRTNHKKDARTWTYTDIKMIKLVSPRELELLTYEASPTRLGRDKVFEFKVLKGELPKVVSDFLAARVARPMASSFVESEEKAVYEIPARHHHRLGDCEGTIKVYADRVVYQSEQADSSRVWRWSDIQSISRAGPYRFAITSYEPKLGGPTKVYNFDLKGRMGDQVYDYLWAKLYHVPAPASAKERQY